MYKIAIVLCLVSGTANAQYRGALDMNMPPSFPGPTFDQQNNMQRMQQDFDRKLDEQRRSLQLQMDNQPRLFVPSYNPPIMR